MGKRQNQQKPPAANKRLIYEAIFRKSLRLYRDILDKTSEFIQGSGKIQEYEGSEYLVILLAETGEVQLVNKSTVDSVVLDESEPAPANSQEVEGVADGENQAA